MNCYTQPRLIGERRSAPVFSIWIILVSLIFSCNPPVRHRPDRVNDVSDPVKPAIDSLKVIGTLELYRDKRYESINEALGAGPENVHKLILYDRGLSELPSEIGKLTYLASLDVSP